MSSRVTFDYNNCRILLFHGRGIMSTLIRWQTRSYYSHAGILLPDGVTILESWQTKGVQTIPLKDRTDIHPFVVEGMSEANWEVAINHSLGLVGLPYDYKGVFRFLSRTVSSPLTNTSYFCSELVFEACQVAGINLLSRIPANEVSPQHLAISPKLIPATWPVKN